MAAKRRSESAKPSGKSKRKSTRAAPASPPVPAHYEPYPIPFNNHTATAVRVPINADIDRLVAALNLPPCRSALFISGGAGLMSDEDMARIRRLLDGGVAGFAQEHALAIVDGGTSAGVPLVLGEIRRERGYTFPLIGVAPTGMIHDPTAGDANTIELDPGHSHFVLVDAPNFGDESDTIVQLTTRLAGEGTTRLLGLIINGGEIARQETYERALHSSLVYRLLTFAGSGRFGGDMARAAQGEPVEDPRIATILSRSDVHVIPADAEPETLYAELAASFP